MRAKVRVNLTSLQSVNSETLIIQERPCSCDFGICSYLGQVTHCQTLVQIEKYKKDIKI